MERFEIKNIGPIKDVEFNLNKVNVLMGPQSSGKSTIAKLVSFCQWVEKRFILDGIFEYDFKEQFMNFHRISEPYFSSKSFFSYQSDFINISYKGLSFQLKITKKDNDINYKKSKNIYIPAERNFVSVIPNLGKYNETNDNIISFLYDWFDAKKSYGKKNSLPLLNLGVNYYYSKENDSDVLRLDDSKKELLLKNASSGLQSLAPMLIFIEYLTSEFFKEKKSNSFNENEEVAKTFIKTFSYVLDNSKRISDVKKSLNDEATFHLTESEVRKMVNLLENRRDYHFANFIFEEPEQNVFPQTQRDFIYYLFEKIVKSERPNNLLITTHSPFILYAINNCLMGNVIKDEMPSEEQLELPSHNSWIDPKLVSIWQVENGKIESVIDKRTGTVTKHYFNQVLNKLMDEYYEMLNYFEYDKQANREFTKS